MSGEGQKQKAAEDRETFVAIGVCATQAFGKGRDIRS